MNKILYIQYTNPACYPPLEHSARILAKEGWEILFLGVHVRGVEELRMSEHPKIKIKMLRYSTPGFWQKAHYFLYGWWVLIHLLVWRPKIIYQSDPLTCPVGYFLSLLSGVDLIYHEHDSPDSDGPGTGFFNRVTLFFRRKVLERAKACVFPNKERMKRAPHYNKGTGKFFCVWNCPLKDEVSMPTELGKGEDFWLLYQGSIVPDRLPLTLIEALAVLPETVKLRIIGYETIGHSGYFRQFMSKASDLRVAGRIEYLGMMPRTALLQYSRLSHVGLVLIPRDNLNINMTFMIGASCKSFDYLACGLPVLVSDLPDWRKMFVDSGYGLACDPGDSRSIVDAVRWLIQHPDAFQQMSQAGQQQIIKEWNYEKQCEAISPIFKSTACLPL